MNFKNNALISLLIIILILCLPGCSTVNSSLNYTKGTEALERGDYEESIRFLEEAVRLDPKLSRNHNNLGYAYLQTGRHKKGWFHVRQAVLLDPNNRYAVATFLSVWNNFEADGLFALGTSETRILSELEEPDIRIGNEKEIVLIYGLKMLRFRDSELYSIEEFSGK